MVDKEKIKKIVERLTEIRQLLNSLGNNPMDSEMRQALLGALEALEEELRVGYILKEKG
jgi:hypothetical protein